MNSHRSASERGFANFSANLHTVTPYLHKMADNLLAAAPGAQWNVLIGDDIGGRLPAYFARNVLRSAGCDAPTFYVAGSAQTRQEFGKEAYTEYFAGVAKQLGVHSLRPLVVTEITSSGGALSFLREALEPISQNVETAAAVNKYPAAMQTTYFGEQGLDPARNIYKTFEAITPDSRVLGGLRKAGEYLPATFRSHAPQRMKSVGVSLTGELLGIRPPEDMSHGPVTTRTAERPPFIDDVQHIMDGLVEEYCLSRNMPLLKPDVELGA